MDFSLSKWIWFKKGSLADEYGEFYTEFDYSSGKAELLISAESDYAVYLNGSLLCFGQYACFPYDRIYDRIDITDKVNLGKNSLAIVVWHYGLADSFTSYISNAALRFEVKSGEKILAMSSEKTLSRESRAYLSHRKKSITAQLGYSFFYDATREDAWNSGELFGFSESYALDISPSLRPRPIEKLELCEPKPAKPIKYITPCDVICDLGVNSVGFICIDVESEREQTLTIAYGEHIEDGAVRRKIATRDFSVEIKVKAGRTRYMNPFRRLGCKYLEVFSEHPLTSFNVGIAETMYPVRHLPRPALTEFEEKIYNICERTLRLCMHEHYEDCPWREQSFYCMDSRNQMLFGYYAFGEHKFVRASLELISKDSRWDKLLSITYPTSNSLIIPSFSLYYFIACNEYLRETGDVDFIKSIYPKLKSIISAFEEKIDENVGLVSSFVGKEYWNFYEWTDGLSNDVEIETGGKEKYFDVLLNSLLVIAYTHLSEMAKSIGEKDDFENIISGLRESIYREFYSSERGVFLNKNDGDAKASVLGNSLAILAGVVTGKEAESVTERMISVSSGLTDVSLSMKCFFYDALLSVSKEKYAEYILSDIEKIYKPMVDYGVGTVWETELGEADFGGAGSLCHGWSALPIYYYHILKK